MSTENSNDDIFDTLKDIFGIKDQKKDCSHWWIPVDSRDVGFRCKFCNMPLKRKTL